MKKSDTIRIIILSATIAGCYFLIGEWMLHVSGYAWIVVELIKINEKMGENQSYNNQNT